MKKCLLFLLVVPVCWAFYVSAGDEVFEGQKLVKTAKDRAVLPKNIHHFLIDHCMECHDADTQEGGVSFEGLDVMKDAERVNLLGQVEEQLYLKNMPPKKRDPVTEKENQMMTRWIDSEYIRMHKKSVFKQKLKKPKYGNYVSHKKLFSGAIKEKPWSPARRWLISPHIFNEKVKELIKLPERILFSQAIRRSILNPFHLSDKEAIQYYDNEILSEGHLSTILANAQWIADKQLEAILIKTGKVTAKKRHSGGNSYVDEWNFETTAILEDIITSKEAPSDTKLETAIQEQFDLVLNRRATAEELKMFLQFTRDNIKTGGRVMGVRNMLASVFMEEEIYYRSEFGHGKPDVYGRKFLAPKEAAYAIAYALTDASPDKALMKAAEDGRLSSKADFKREVLRLLGDNTKRYTLDDELWHHRYRISNPRVLRFFRDFFGYPKARKIFKDRNRYWGVVYHPVPHRLVREADQLLEHWLKLDQNVFENMLGSDKFYVFHDGDNKKTDSKVKSLARGFKQHREKLEGLDWKKDPEKAFVAAGMLKAVKDKGKVIRRNSRNYHLKKLINKTKSADVSVGRGFRPVPFRRYDMHVRQTHVHTYNIDVHNWDYETIQPFSLPNRKGILTHPAWLIAQSKNTANDPVHRGMWILKTLLAGHVLDVPVTVDAAVPEHKDLTLRDRLAGVTEKKSCWKCHKKMNPLGYPFEQYNDFGVFREEESLEYEENIIKPGTLKPNVPNTYKKAPVNPRSVLVDTGDKSLDGEVSGAVDLMGRLSQSELVRQSIIRHAFRYFMGRNEMLSDSQTLIEADKAYVRSGGSFNAVIVSLLTSDSFVYRKQIDD